jgi:hypothetical protein
LAVVNAHEVCRGKKKGKIKYTFEKKSQEESTAYCFDKERDMLYSFYCFQNKDCQAKKFRKNDYSFDSESGSPGFKLCQWFYLGIPQLIEYWDGKHWVSSSRCIFPDKSFIDIATLEMFSK